MRARHLPGLGIAVAVQITRNISRGLIHNANVQFILKKFSWTQVLEATEREVKKLFTQENKRIASPFSHLKEKLANISIKCLEIHLLPINFPNAN